MKIHPSRLVLYKSDFTGDQWNQIVVNWADSYNIPIMENADTVELIVTEVDFSKD